MDDIPRKSAREEELDHLFAEEFACDPGFASRYLAACGLKEQMVVERVTSQPSLDGNGFGDLLVDGYLSHNHYPVTLLIEHKIGASPAHRQAERYQAYAERLRRDHDFDIEVLTILAAPASYRGERDQYDASIDLETAAEMIQSDNPVRQEWRRDIVARAIAKKAATGVQNADEDLRQLRADHYDFMLSAAQARGLDLTIPPLRNAYHDADCWITEIKMDQLPDNVSFRHRLWTKAADQTGMVDLIIEKVSPAQKEELAAKAPEWAATRPYGENKSKRGLEHAKGIQISARVPEMRQSDGFSPEIGEIALQRMVALADWYAQAVR